MGDFGIGVDKGRHIVEGRREARNTDGRNLFSSQDPTTIANVVDIAAHHSDNDVSGVDIEVEEASNPCNFSQVKLCRQVSGRGMDLRVPDNLVQDVICVIFFAAHGGMA